MHIRTYMYVFTHLTDAQDLYSYSYFYLFLTWIVHAPLIPLAPLLLKSVGDYTVVICRTLEGALASYD